MFACILSRWIWIWMRKLTFITLILSLGNAYKYWYVDRPPKNRDNIKTRAFWSDPVVTPPSKFRWRFLFCWRRPKISTTFLKSQTESDMSFLESLGSHFVASQNTSWGAVQERRNTKPCWGFISTHVSNLSLSNLYCFPSTVRLLVSFLQWCVN